MNESASSTVDVLASGQAAGVHPVAARQPLGRVIGAFGVLELGALALEWRLGDAPEVVAAWLLLGAVGGAVAGRARLGWLAAVAGLALYPLGVVIGLAPRLGPWWILQALLAAVVLGAGFGVGATSGPGRQPWNVARRSWGGARRRQRVVAASALVVPMLVLAGYVGYAAAVGSETFIHPDPEKSCVTPTQAFGWSYEAINYDIADDARLAAANPDPQRCSSQGAQAGESVVSPDGVHIAGWYIPAGDGAAPTDPTIVIVHGWHGNKSSMLLYAAPLHARFNIVLIDLRGGGRSSRAEVTMGVREQTDLRAMIDWLVATKHPTFIGTLGNSMGGATVLAEAVHDPRVRAVLLESTHASLVTSGGNIAENEHGYPAQPTGWAIGVGATWRIGVDVTSVDPDRTITELGKRPVLIIHGTADQVDYPATSAEVNLHAALEAGVPASLVYCPGGPHGKSVEACPDLWSSAANAFFAEAAGGGR